MTYAIDSAAESDCEALAELMRKCLLYELRKGDGNVISAEAIRRFCFGKQKCCDCLIVKRSGVAIGYVTYTFRFSTDAVAPALSVHELFIVESARREHKIGTSLANELFCRAKNRGCVFAEWLTFAHNDTAKMFFESFDASFREDLHVYRVRLETAFAKLEKSREERNGFLSE